MGYDFDLNGAADNTGLGGLLNVFNSMTALNWGNGNLNDDGIVDSADLGLMLNNFNFPPASVVAVPEVHGWLMSGMGMLFWMGLKPLRERR